MTSPVRFAPLKSIFSENLAYSQQIRQPYGSTRIFELPAGVRSIKSSSRTHAYSPMPSGVGHNNKMKLYRIYARRLFRRPFRDVRRKMRCLRSARELYLRGPYPFGRYKIHRSRASLLSKTNLQRYRDGYFFVYPHSSDVTRRRLSHCDRMTIVEV
jgi:hypothetical protein